jgi:hypothetical protein
MARTKQVESMNQCRHHQPLFTYTLSQTLFRLFIADRSQVHRRKGSPQAGKKRVSPLSLLLTRRIFGVFCRSRRTLRRNVLKHANSCLFLTIHFFHPSSSLHYPLLNMQYTARNQGKEPKLWLSWGHFVGICLRLLQQAGLPLTWRLHTMVGASCTRAETVHDSLPVKTSLFHQPHVNA